MIRGVKGSLLAAVSLAFAGCAASGTSAQSAGDKPAASAEKPVKINKDPYPCLLYTSMSDEILQRVAGIEPA